MKFCLAPVAMMCLLASGAEANQPDPPITLAGTKEIHLGMPLAQAVESFALEAPFYLNDESCGTTSYDYPPLTLSILAIDGKVSRLSFEARFENIPETSYVTPEGIRLGSTVWQVIEAFPNAERSFDENSGYLKFFAWEQPGISGWLFEVSPTTNRVVSVTVGDASIAYYEGCA